MAISDARKKLRQTCSAEGILEFSLYDSDNKLKLNFLYDLTILSTLQQRNNIDTKRIR